nr:hypothetical protein [Tanacetum cinerariifolium]
MKFKQRVRKLEKKRELKASGLKRLRKVVSAQRVESSTDTVMDDQEDASKQGGIAELDADEDVTLKEVLAKVAKDADDKAYARELEAALNANINWSEVIEQVKRKEKQDNTVMRYQALKRKPQTEAHARKNMMVYLKNMAGFKIDFFKGMTYDEIRLIFKKHFNYIVAFLEKRENELEEEASKQSKRKSETSEEKAAKKQKLDEEVEELKTHLQIIHNDEDDVYTEATPLALKSLEDLEMLWKIVQKRFSSSNPKNFSDDFLLNALKTMFKKLNVEAHIWKNQRGSYGLAKVKS